MLTFFNFSFRIIDVTVDVAIIMPLNFNNDNIIKLIFWYCSYYVALLLKLIHFEFYAYNESVNQRGVYFIQGR